MSDWWKALRRSGRFVSTPCEDGVKSRQPLSVLFIEGRRSGADARRMPPAGRPSPEALLRDCVVLDEKGFVKAGPDLQPSDLARSQWPLSRPPLLFETNRPGVFAVGDVRAGSVKRVAAAVGEGSVCIQLVHKVLAE